MTRHFGWPLTLSLLTFGMANLVIAGLLTNWFRYGPSLEVLFVLAAQIAGLLIVSVAAIVVRVRRAGAVPLVIAVVVATGVVLWAMKASHGVYLPAWQWNDVTRSPEQELSLKTGERLEYYLEVRNPFASRSTVIVVITDRRGEHRIRLPWNASIGSFLSPIDGMEWATLSDVRSDEAALLLKTTIDPSRPRSFLIDLQREKAREVR